MLGPDIEPAREPSWHVSHHTPYRRRPVPRPDVVAAPKAPRPGDLRRRALRITLAAFSMLVLASGVLTIPIVPVAGAAPAPSSHPNTYQAQQLPAKGTPPRPAPLLSGPPSDKHPRKPPFTPSMKPLTLALSATQPTSATSSDGVLEVDVPAGAVSSADEAAAGGPIHLVVTEVAPPSGSTTGGHISLGTYLLQLQNPAGKELPNGAGLHKNIALRYLWKSKHSPVPLDRFIAVMNGAAPVNLGLPVAHQGKHQSVATTYDRATTSINAVVPLAASSSTAAFDTDSPEGFFGKADIFQNDLHTGTLTNSIDLDLPTGPGRLTPPLHLSYSSAGVNANTNAQAAGPWVGEGWSLDLGSITWSEYNTTSNSTTATWENAWSISDPFGASSELIPPNINVSTYFDDTSNPVPTGAPILWHTAPEMHAKIVSYTNPTVDCVNFPQTNVCGHGNYPVQPPCWRVFLPNGIMEEYGCTPDSLQWYPGSPSGTTNYPSVWKLDMITDPNGNQIHVIYKRDMSTANGNSYVRDIVIDHIEYDAPACHDANTMCTGASWNPRVQVVFSSGNAVTHPYPGRSSCGPNGALRCDDPAPQTSPNLGTPLITPTQVLNDLYVKVYNNATWNTLRSYQFKYEQGPAAGTIADPITGNVESVNGFLLLDQFQEFGADGATSYPPQTFTYANPDGEWYEDSAYHPAAGTPCGPSWNTGNKPSGNTGCALWWENFNIFYLSEVDNGKGAQQTFTWLDMRTNQHGVDAGQNALDPSYCTVHQSGNYPCDLADDNGWSHISLTSRTVTVKSPTSSNPNQTTTSTWTYTYQLSSLVAQECGDCTVGFYWGNANNGDYLDFYEGQFKGYAFAQAVNPDNSAENDYFYATDGWGVYDNSQVGCFDGQPVCPNAPYWHTNNAASGRPYQVDTFGVQSGGVYPLMRRMLTTYTVTCPPAGVAGSPAQSPWGNWDGNLVEELNHNNPVASCDVQVGSAKTYYANGVNGPSDTTVPWAQTADVYNGYGQLTQSTITGNDLGGTPTTVQAFDYIWNDAVSTSNTSATGTYIVDRQADAFTKDGSGVVKGCAYSRYDGLATAATGQNGGLTRGLKTATDAYASCANKTGPVSPTTAYNANGDPIGSKDADAIAGVAGHLATSGACSGYTSCTVYDGAFGNLKVTEGNALNQTTSTGYTATSAFGFGLWPSSATDLNGQVASVAYDVLGRVTSTTSPGEGTGLTTTSTAYAVWCPATGASAPCLEVDRTQRLDSATTVTARTFYDGLGRVAETRSPAPGGNDVVQYMLYNSIGKVSFQSQPYYVAAYAGGPGAAAYATPDTTQPGTSYAYDGLGNVTSVTDPLSHVITATYTSPCNVAGTSDSACYVATTTTDANGHKSAGYEDAAGRTIYGQDWTGTSGSGFTLYRTIKSSYDYLGRQSSITYADGSHTASVTYNDLGQATASSDPDLGGYSFTYDQNSNLLSSADPRGASGTVNFGYDGLNRPLWTSVNSNGSSPFASYTYDGTAGGNKGVGHLTSETFASGPSQSVTGSYAYTYDARGRTTGWTMALGGSSYPFTFAYNDADQATSVAYPDGDTVTTSYGAQDWLAGVTETLGGTTTTLLNAVTYSGTAGASGLITGGQVGNGTYKWSLGYDNADRLTDTNVQLVSTGATLYDQARTYDAVGNVLTANTTLPAGTDNQLFCYDSLNRLTWAGAKGNPPSGCGSLSAGTLRTAQYTQSYAYDTLDRLTTGPQGSGYTYGDAGHLNAVTSANGYTAAYDAAGDMTCRALTTKQACSGTPTGQAMGYDTLRRLISWQDAATNPTQTASYAYNGAGERVWQQVNNAGTVTTTTYVGNFEEIRTSGSTTTTTKYYAAGVTTAVSVNGTISYLVSDGLGSTNVALSSSGSVTATQLYTPYGSTRYSSGTMPTALGFTGQYLDGSGLNYFHARYYDPTVGQFTCADAVQGPNRYGYVGGNPETLTDPTGHDWWSNTLNAAGNFLGNAASTVCDLAFGCSDIQNDVSTLQNPNASGWDTFGACVNLTFNVGMDISYFIPGVDVATLGVDAGVHLVEDVGVHGLEDLASHGGADLVGHLADDGLAHLGEDGASHGATSLAADAGGDAASHGGDDALSHATDDTASHAADDGASHADAGSGGDSGGGGEGGGGCNSFRGDTAVATPAGAVAIDTLRVGDQVLAYDSASGKVQAEPVQHVFVNHDDNLLDVTLASDATSQQAHAADGGTAKQHDADLAGHGSQAPPSRETLHTTTEHPFLTDDRGFVAAQLLRPGERVRKLDGSFATVVGLKRVAGVAVRYNLTVGVEHTFVVGTGQYVVHNTGTGPKVCDTLQPGPYAGESIPARGPKTIGDFTPAEHEQIDKIGYDTGCHTCGTKDPGTKSGQFIPDHQPPDQLNANGGPQRLYPHCLACSHQQGGEVNAFKWMLQNFFAK